MRILAIDLGTTNTVAAIENFPLPISGEDGRSTLPSVVSFLPDGTIQYGIQAKRRRSIDPPNTIFSAKRILGRRWSEATTRDFCDRYPFEMIEIDDDTPAFVTRAGPFTATDIAATLLSGIFSQVKHVPGGFERTIVSVPAGFDGRQRSATVAAAEKAELPSVRLIDEPLATAHAYMAVSNPVSMAAVYDLGGGTFDFSIVDWTRGTPRLLASQSDLLLGGDDVDQLLAGWVVEHVLERYNWDLASYTEVYARLLVECERAKIRLSFFDETAIDLSEVDPDCPARFEPLQIRRELLDRISEDLVRRTFVTCDRVLAEAGLRCEDLKAVFMAGGSTHLDKVREGVENYFGKPGRFELEPSEVVAMGASLVDWTQGD